MKKIPSLFKRDYSGNRHVYNEVVPGCEWVLDGDGFPSAKWDGTACLFFLGVLYKRYDRKPTKEAKRMKRVAEKEGLTFFFSVLQAKEAPEGWMPVEEGPDSITGHWPGWVPVDFDRPEDKWHKEAWEHAELTQGILDKCPLTEGTYELVGPKVQGNPHGFHTHRFIHHGEYGFHPAPPRTFDGLEQWLEEYDHYEGLVWHHEDGRMAKIKRRDFGLPWPIIEE